MDAGAEARRVIFVGGGREEGEELEAPFSRSVDWAR